jgi:hypothetical protein
MEADPISKMLCSSVFLEYHTVDKAQEFSNPEQNIMV